MNSTRIVTALFALVMLTTGCDNDAKKQQPEGFSGMVINGEAQGTTYTIKYLDTAANFKPQVDSMLLLFDQDLSLWREGSLINQINNHNRRDTVFAFVDSTKYFSVVFDLSREIYKKTGGAFDPTVRPLVEAWGFGLKNQAQVTDDQIAEIMNHVGFTDTRIDMIELYENDYFYKETNIWKGDPLAQLDFNAIAQGYSVDLIVEFLIEKGIKNFMVELGGEVYCHGVNDNGDPWRIAIDKPIEDAVKRELQAIIPIKDGAVATSGNYRNFYIQNGKKYAHTIDPRTGYPVDHNLLSATVVASNCAEADAYATAFMVMGVNEAAEFLNNNPDVQIEVYLVYEDEGEMMTVMTEGLASVVQNIE